MTTNLNKARLSALLCGAILFSLPALAAGAGGTAGGGIGTGAVTGADEHAGLPQPGEEILLAVGCGHGGADLPP